MKKRVFLLLLFLLTACSPKPAKVEEPVPALPPMVRVDGEVYKDTGYVNSLVTCGTADGQILSKLEESKKPDRDDQSNFGTGYDYQYWQKGFINAKIGKDWKIFQSLDSDQKDIPYGVAYFEGRVLETGEDRILLEATKVEEEFPFKKDLTKPISLPIDHLDSGEDPATKDLEGKMVKVYFDGKVKNTDPAQFGPLELGEIYKIRVL